MSDNAYEIERSDKIFPAVCSIAAERWENLLVGSTSALRIVASSLRPIWRVVAESCFGMIGLQMILFLYALDAVVQRFGSPRRW